MFRKELISELARARITDATLNSLLTVQRQDVASNHLGHVPVALLTPSDPTETVAIHLDGGIGDRESLVKRQPLLAQLHALDVLPHAVHVSFSGGSNVFYTGAWETWVMEELPTWLNQTLGINLEPARTFITGISGGGHGALKFAFNHPERFAAVAAMEPVILPALAWPRPHTRPGWWLLEASARAVWGDPFPETFFAQHPPNIVARQAQRIRDAGLEIYLEVGDEDMLKLNDGSEFLHRLLWHHDIAHEYHQCAGRTMVATASIIDLWKRWLFSAQPKPARGGNAAICL